MNTFELMKLIGEAPPTLLNCTETNLLMRMALFGDRSGKGIKPGIVELSKKTKICQRTVKSTLKILIRKNVIICRHIRKHGTSDRSCYEINFSFLQEIISGKVGAPHAPTVGASDALTLDHKNKKVGAFYAKVGAPHAPTVGASDAPTPYTQLFINQDQQSNVELASNSTTSFSEKKPKKKNDLKQKLELDKVNDIFDHWRKVLNHPRSKIDGPRKTKILNALKLGFSVEELKKVIEAVKKTPWNMGDNPSGKKYHDICLIFRNSDQIERFLDNFDASPRGELKNVSTAKKNAFWENTKTMGEVLDFYDPLKDRKLTKQFPEENNDEPK